MAHLRPSVIAQRRALRFRSGIFSQMAQYEIVYVCRQVIENALQLSYPRTIAGSLDERLDDNLEPDKDTISLLGYVSQ